MKVSTPPAEAEAVAALLMSLAILSTFEEKRKSQTGKGLTNGEWPWLRQADALDAFMEDITAKAAEPTGDDTSVSKKACSILDLSKLAFWATVYGKIAEGHVPYSLERLWHPGKTCRGSALGTGQLTTGSLPEMYVPACADMCPFELCPERGRWNSNVQET